MVAGIAVLAVVGGGVAAGLLLGSGTAVDGSGQALPGAVEKEPTEVWSYSTDSYGDDFITGVWEVADLVVVGDQGSNGSVALDRDGQEVWRSDAGSVDLVLAEEGLLVVSDWEDTGFRVLDAETGQVIWSRNDLYVRDATGQGLLAGDDDEVTMLDPRSGEVLWQTRGVDTWASTDDAVYTASGSLSRLDLADGDVDWTIPLPPLGVDEYRTLVATETMVVASDRDAVAYSADQGEQLWTETGGYEGVSVGQVWGDRVYVAAIDSYEDDTTPVRVLDADGEVGRLETQEGVYPYFEHFRLGGEDYALSSSGTLYARDLTIAGRYSGTFAVAASGIYTLSERGEVALHKIGTTAPRWTAPIGSEGSLIPLDGRLAIVEENQVTVYE